MSGVLPSLPSAHDVAASSAGASAHGRGPARAVRTRLAVPASRVTGTRVCAFAPLHKCSAVAGPCFPAS
jgi:hypothetical protein